MIGRGEDAEITTYLEKAVTSELSGNLVDVCPVGALTSKPYAFNARPWELTKTESIDVMDAVGSAIRIDARGPEVLRVLPRVNEEINEEWISDKTRHACDGLGRQRLDRPYVRVGGKLKEATWAEAFAAVAAKIKAAAPDRIGVIAGDLQDAESMKAAMDLFTSLGSPNIDCRQDGSALHPKYGRESYLFNSTIAGIEDADAIMIIGSNPRKEAAMVNARIRKRWLASLVLLGLIGEQADLSYQYNYLGAGADSLAKFAEHGPIQKEKPMFIVGAGAVAGEGGAAVLALAAKSAASMGLVKDGWNGWNVLHTAASRVGGLDMGFVPGDGGKTAVEMVSKGALDVLFLLGADEIDLSASDAFTVYLGSHGDRGAALHPSPLRRRRPPSPRGPQLSAAALGGAGRLQQPLGPGRVCTARQPHRHSAEPTPALGQRVGGAMAGGSGVADGPSAGADRRRGGRGRGGRGQCCHEGGAQLRGWLRHLCHEYGDVRGAQSQPPLRPLACVERAERGRAAAAGPAAQLRQRLLSAGETEVGANERGVEGADLTRFTWRCRCTRSPPLAQLLHSAVTSARSTHPHARLTKRRLVVDVGA